MTYCEIMHGATAGGLELTGVYMENRTASVGFGLVSAAHGLPHVVHWGRPLADPKTVLDEYDALCPQRVSGALDDTPWPSLLPTQSEGWIGATRLVVRRSGVELFCHFDVTAVKVEENPCVCVIAARDAEQGVGMRLLIELDRSGLVRQRASICNIGDGALEVDKVELGFALPAQATELLTMTGHHLRERSPQRQPLTVGRFEKPSLTGRPDFDASLLMCAGEPGFGFEHGEVYAVHVGWSGNSMLAAERLAYTQAVIGGGEVLFGGEVTLPPSPDRSLAEDVDIEQMENVEDEDGVYTSPWIYGAYGDGLNAVAAQFHGFVRSKHPRLASKPRPVLLNTWEAVYFHHDYDTLAALADRAAREGVERFVVDDGWFGSRRDDRSGLGDWWISQDVWPDGPRSLHALADHVHGLGMEFGLWFEPEMVNLDSEMARRHPDWVLRPTPLRLPMQGRSQQVLDLTNPQAYDAILTAMNSLIARLGIDYIKWDHNKMVTEAVSPRSGRPAVHEQTRAVYRLFRALKTEHPGLEIESCASGGGRVDLGILQLADRIWVSDCVDPVERADIQRYTSLLVPPEMMGEHIGASPAHATQRATSQEMRMALAFFGHMGIEWNLLKESDAAIAMLGRWVSAYKQNRGDFAGGTAVHADSADAAVRLDGVVAANGRRAVYRFVQLTSSQTYPAAPVRLPGLDPAARYRVRPLDVSLDAAADGIVAGQSPLGWWSARGVVLSGVALETYGIRPPCLHVAQAVLFEAVRVGDPVVERAS